MTLVGGSGVLGTVLAMVTIILIGVAVLLGAAIVFVVRNRAKARKASAPTEGVVRTPPTPEELRARRAEVEAWGSSEKPKRSRGRDAARETAAKEAESIDAQVEEATLRLRGLTVWLSSADDRVAHLQGEADSAAHAALIARDVAVQLAEDAAVELAARDALTEAQAVHVTLSADRNSVQAEIDELMVKLEVLRARARDLDGHLALATDELAARQAEFDAVSGAVERAERAEEAANLAEAQRDDLVAAVAENATTLEERRAEAATLAAEVDTLRRKARSLRDKHGLPAPLSLDVEPLYVPTDVNPDELLADPHLLAGSPARQDGPVATPVAEASPADHDRPDETGSTDDSDDSDNDDDGDGPFDGGSDEPDEDGPGPGEGSDLHDDPEPDETRKDELNGDALMVEDGFGPLDDASQAPDGGNSTDAPADPLAAVEDSDDGAVTDVSDTLDHEATEPDDSTATEVAQDDEVLGWAMLHAFTDDPDDETSSEQPVEGPSNAEDGAEISVPATQDDFPAPNAADRLDFPPPTGTHGFVIDTEEEPAVEDPDDGPTAEASPVSEETVVVQIMTEDGDVLIDPDLTIEGGDVRGPHGEVVILPPSRAERRAAERAAKRREQEARKEERRARREARKLAKERRHHDSSIVPVVVAEHPEVLTGHGVVDDHDNLTYELTPGLSELVTLDEAEATGPVPSPAGASTDVPALPSWWTVESDDEEPAQDPAGAATPDDDDPVTWDWTTSESPTEAETADTAAPDVADDGIVAEDDVADSGESATTWWLDASYEMPGVDEVPAGTPDEGYVEPVASGAAAPGEGADEVTPGLDRWATDGGFDVDTDGAVAFDDEPNEPTVELAVHDMPDALAAVDDADDDDRPGGETSADTDLVFDDPIGADSTDDTDDTDDLPVEPPATSAWTDLPAPDDEDVPVDLPAPDAETFDFPEPDAGPALAPTDIDTIDEEVDGSEPEDEDLVGLPAPAQWGSAYDLPAPETDESDVFEATMPVVGEEPPAEDPLSGVLRELVDDPEDLAKQEKMARRMRRRAQRRGIDLEKVLTGTSLGAVSEADAAPVMRPGDIIDYREYDLPEDIPDRLSQK